MAQAQLHEAIGGYLRYQSTTFSTNTQNESILQLSQCFSSSKAKLYSSQLILYLAILPCYTEEMMTSVLKTTNYVLFEMPHHAKIISHFQSQFSFTLMSLHLILKMKVTVIWYCSDDNALQ